MNNIGAPNQTEFPTKATAVTPHDTNVLTSPGTIYVGVGGNVSVVPWEGGTTAVLFKNLPTGAVIPVNLAEAMAGYPDLPWYDLPVGMGDEPEPELVAAVNAHLATIVVGPP